MATPKLLRPHLRLSHPPLHHRTFFPNPFAPSSTSAAQSDPPQTLTAHRTLPFPSAPIYSIIADVPSYASFLPYLERSDITHWSAPDPVHARRWPSAGTLTTGFGGLSETFASRVYCVPGRVVESVGGGTESRVPVDQIAHHLVEGKSVDVGAGVRDNGILRHLRSTWTVEEVGAGRTRVGLAIEYAFANPFYAALSGGVAPKVAEAMIRAFEQRVGAVLRENPDMVGAALGDMDGSRLKR